MQALCVSRAEAGQKLFHFLARRLTAVSAELHRWIRTGQIRVNGGRAKPFDRLAEGDTVRVPPFAPLRHGAESKASGNAPSLPSTCCLDIVWENPDILILDKPAGLSAQGGTGHRDSVASRLAQLYAETDFIPAPVHRLDRDTSGLMLAGKSYLGLRTLSDLLAGKASDIGNDSLIKTYLVWVHGIWPYAEEQRLRDHMMREQDDPVCGQAKGKKHSPPQNRVKRSLILDHADDRIKNSREAICTVRPLRFDAQGGFSLLSVRLLTGRTHQIRVQLASRGFPVVGDGLYGPEKAGKKNCGLKLHAFHLRLPACAVLTEPLELTQLPSWQGKWQCKSPLL